MEGKRKLLYFPLTFFLLITGAPLISSREIMVVKNTNQSTVYVRGVVKSLSKEVFTAPSVFPSNDKTSSDESGDGQPIIYFHDFMPSDLDKPLVAAVHQALITDQNDNEHENSVPQVTSSDKRKSRFPEMIMSQSILLIVLSIGIILLIASSAGLLLRRRMKQRIITPDLDQSLMGVATFEPQHN